MTPQAVSSQQFHVRDCGDRSGVGVVEGLGGLGIAPEAGRKSPTASLALKGGEIRFVGGACSG